MKVVGGLDVRTASVSHPTDLSFSERAMQLMLGKPGSHLSQVIRASQCKDRRDTDHLCSPPAETLELN